MVFFVRRTTGKRTSGPPGRSGREPGTTNFPKKTIKIIGEEQNDELFRRRKHSQESATDASSLSTNANLSSSHQSS